MKKLFLIIATTIMASTAWAQSQLLTVKGKTKDGKNINVQYYKGTAQDYIESVKYQLVDELKAENKTKQNSINDLQYQLNKANKTIDNLKDQMKASESGQSANYNEQLAQKDREIEELNKQIELLNKQLGDKQKENDKLQNQVDSLKTVNNLLSQKKNRIALSSFVGVEGSMGGVVLLGDHLNNPWEKVLSWDKQVAVYYGTGSLLNNFPVSVEAGVGFRSLPLSAHADHYQATGAAQKDSDGQDFIPNYVFDNYSEKLTLNFLDIPIRLCIGQPNKNKVSLYTKLGITPSFLLSAKLANGNFSRKGYYPDWNVTFEDIEELDYFNNEGEGTNSVTPSKKFNLNGNLAFGAYVPLTHSTLFNVGARFDYPFTKTGTFANDASSSANHYNQYLPEDYRSGLSRYNGRMFTSSLQLGLIYTLQ